MKMGFRRPSPGLNEYVVFWVFIGIVLVVVAFVVRTSASPDARGILVVRAPQSICVENGVHKIIDIDYEKTGVLSRLLIITYVDRKGDIVVAVAESDSNVWSEAVRIVDGGGCPQ